MLPRYTLPFKSKSRNLYSILYRFQRRNITEQSWDKFLQITSRAAKFIPLEQLDLDRYHLVSVFPANDLNMETLIPKLAHHEEGDYISYTIVLLLLRLNRVDDAFQVFRMLSKPYVPVGSFELLDFKKFKAVPQYHLHLLDLLQNRNELKNNFEFQGLRIKLLGRIVRLDEVTRFRDEILGHSSDWKQEEVRYFYNLILQLYGIEFGREELVKDLLEEMEERGLRLRSEYLILMKTYSINRQFDSVIELFFFLDKEDKLSPPAVTFLIKAYCELGYLNKARNASENYSQYMSLYGWTALIHGYCKSNRRSRMWRAEKMVEDLMAEGRKIDQSIYHSLLYGYARKMVPRKFIEWFEKMESAGIKPDHYTYGILQKMQHMYIYQSPKILERDAAVRMWLNDKITTLERFEGDHSQMSRIVIAVRTGKIPSYEELIETLEEYPRLVKYPGLYANVLSYLVKSSSHDVPRFVDYMKAKGVRFTARIYSLMILMCRKRRGIPSEGWKLLQGMVADGIEPDEYTYRNLISLAIKTTDIRRLRGMISSLLGNRKAPITRALYRDLVGMLCHRKAFYIPLSIAADNRNIHPRGRNEEQRYWLEKQQKYESTQQHYIQLAIQVLEHQCEQKIQPRWSQLYMAFVACLVSTNPQVYFPKLMKVFKNMSPKDQEEGMTSLKNLLLEANFVELIDEMMILNEDNHSDETLMESHLKRLGQIKDVDALYTLAIFLSRINAKLLGIAMEQIGLYSRDETMSRLLWQQLPSKVWTEQLIWVKVRCLIWWGCHAEAVQECSENLEVQSNFSGFVVLELQKWLRSRSLTELEEKLVLFWSSRKPEWILEDSGF
jgi:pentatricopeptide repeat protein